MKNNLTKIANKFILVSLVCVALTSCQTTPKSNFDYPSLTSIKEKIKNGASTKDEVLNLLGTPNLMSVNKSGQEVYVWDKRVIMNEKMRGTDASTEQREEKTVTIAITFTDRSIVKEFTLRATSY